MSGETAYTFAARRRRAASETKPTINSAAEVGSGTTVEVFVLIFEPGRTWYFGCDPEMLPNHLIHLAAGGRGHRVSGVNDADADTLEEWLLSIRPAGVSGVPRDGSSARPLSRC